ncbi:MAG: hypothetical protein PHH70_04120 [Candidatus Gracilibacteria bacterium]|nr:hypothetical protein [Candidatus Gracilibacteria bacterium]
MKLTKNPIDIDVYFNTTLPSFIEKTAQEIPALLRDKQKKSSKQYV